MNRVIFILTVLFFVFSCASTKNKQDFEISNSHGQIYSSKNIFDDLKKEYSLERNPVMLILLTDKLDNNEYLIQKQILSRVNAETYEYIYVVGSALEIESSGYNISPTDTKYMLSKNSFMIHIYNRKGELSFTSTKAINESELKKYLTK